MSGPKDFRKSDEKLSTLLVRLIAELDHIDPAEVDVHYIHKQREERIYPKKRYVSGSRYGGYDAIGLYVFTGEELDRIDQLAEDFLETI